MFTKKSYKYYSLIFVLVILVFGLVLLIVQQKSGTNTSSSSNEYKTYVLDTSDIVSREFVQPHKGTLIISHNAMAVFPLNLTTIYKKLDEMASNTISEYQSKEGCWGNEIVFVSDETIKNPPSDFWTCQNNILECRVARLAVKNIQTKDVVNIKEISLEMPFEVTQDNYIRIPQTFCVGLHIKNKGWLWNFKPVKPVLDNTQRMGFGEVSVNQENVDIVAILFDSTTAIRKIQIEAAKLQ